MSANKEDTQKYLIDKVLFICPLCQEAFQAVQALAHPHLHMRTIAPLALEMLTYSSWRKFGTIKNSSNWSTFALQINTCLTTFDIGLHAKNSKKTEFTVIYWVSYIFLRPQKYPDSPQLTSRRNYNTIQETTYTPTKITIVTISGVGLCSRIESSPYVDKKVTSRSY